MTSPPGGDRSDEGDRSDDHTDSDPSDGGDRALDAITALVVLLLLVGVVTIVLTATSAEQELDAAPDADWTLTRINDTHVRIAHAGGDPVRAGNLTVTVDGYANDVRWSDDPVTEDESGVVRADRASRVTLLWQKSRVDRNVLAEWGLQSPSPSP